MKLNKLFLTLATATLMVGCSSDDDSTSRKGGENIGVGNSDVEVHLRSGVGGVTTRASVDADEFGAFEANGIGIFMLATDKTNTNPDEADIVWDADDVDDVIKKTNYAVWLDNEPANAIKTGTQTDIRWATDNTVHWYPIGNWYCYRFYGYYPYVDMDNVIRTSTGRIVYYSDLDGTKDIIWGQSKRCDLADPVERYAYSARYFRQAGKGNDYPEIAFKHEMMRMQFSIVGIMDENAEEGHEYDGANEMFIDTIIVYQVPTLAWLTVADYATPANDGTISYNWTSGLADIGVIGDPDAAVPDGEFGKRQVNGADTIKVGQPLLLPVPDADAVAAGFTKYRIKVRLRNADNVLFDHEKPLDLNVSQAYAASHSYRVVLRIAGPKQVTVRATLEDWVEENNVVSHIQLD